MFLPKKPKIFEALIEQALIAKEAAQIFQNIADNFGQLDDGYTALQKLENRGDELVHSISYQIERTFVLPLDKEDIKLLAEALDDLIDNLEQVANRLYIYKISQSNQALKDFSTLISQAIQKIYEGILIVKERKYDSKDLQLCIEKIHELENEADKLHRRVLENIVGKGLIGKNEEGTHLLEIIKWKEIFQTLEDTMDRCEDFAALFSKLRIKYA